MRSIFDSAGVCSWARLLGLAALYGIASPACQKQRHPSPCLFVLLRDKSLLEFAKPPLHLAHRRCPVLWVASSSAARRTSMSSISIACLEWAKMLSAALTRVDAGVLASSIDLQQ